MRIVMLWLVLTVPTLVIASDWLHYGGDAGGSRYSSLQQISKDNVDQLQVAWQVRTGAIEKRGKLAVTGQFQATPILTPKAAGESLVVCTPWNRILALDPSSGETRWQYDPKLKMFPLYNCRGVSYWHDTQAQPGSVCEHRLYAGTGDLRLIALDARNGKPCEDFGSQGEVNVSDLVQQESPLFKRGSVKFYSPPVVVNGVLITGSSTFAKNRSVANPSGAIRAFDARSGEHLWSFDPIPRDPNDPEHKNWSKQSLAQTGAANAWAPLSFDAGRNLVFVPTSSASPDFFGGFRPGDNRYANSTLALDVSSGKLVWHFQNIHHDVWDWDTPAQPIAVTLKRGQQSQDVVIQLTKQGLVFAFDRDSGEPVFAVEERPVDSNSLIPGEILSPSQPFPVAPPPLAPNGISPDDAWGLTFWDRAQCRKLIEQYNHGPVFTPPSERGTISVASINNWAGGAFDPASNTLVTNASNIFWITRLNPEASYDPQTVENFGPPAPVVEGWGYAVTRVPLVSPWGIPCNAPPWGKLVAVDMAKGEIKWQRPLGSLEKIAPYPVPLEWGTPGAAGGPIITASGLVFIGASSDEKFRAFDLASGEKLWQSSLPSSAMATPMTYQIDGRQYVVVVSGGHVWQYSQNINDYITAFALPKN